MRLFRKILILLWASLFASGVLLAQDPSSSASPPAIEPPPSLDSLLNTADTQDLPFWRQASMGVDGPPDLATMEQLMLAFADGLVPNFNDEDQRKAFVAYLRTRFGDPTRPLPDGGLDSLAALQVVHPEIFWPVAGQEESVPVFPSVAVTQINYQHEVPSGLRELVDLYLDAADAIGDITVGARAMRSYWTSRFVEETEFDALFIERGGPETVASGRQWGEYYTDGDVPIEQRMSALLEQLTDLMTRGGVRRFDDEVTSEEHSNPLRPSARGVGGMRELFVGIAHAAAFLSPTLRQQMRTGDGMEVLHAFRVALGRRDEFVHSFFMFPAEGAFARLVDGLPFASQMAIAQVDRIAEDALAEFERQALATRVENGTTSDVSRQLSPAEKHFRSLIGGSDCSSYNYFLRPPSFQYFTLTDGDVWSDGHITIVMGYATFDGHVVRAGFIDKIQNVPNDQLLVRIEAARLSLAATGVTLVAVDDVDNLINVLSNEDTTTEYFASHVLGDQEHAVGRFTPDPITIELEVTENYSNTTAGALNVVVVPEYQPGDEASIAVVRAAPPWSLASIDLNKILEPLLELKHGNDEQRLQYVEAMVAFRAAGFPVDPKYKTATRAWLRDPAVSYSVKYAVLCGDLLEESAGQPRYILGSIPGYSNAFLGRLRLLTPEQRVDTVNNWIQTPRYSTALSGRTVAQLMPLVGHHRKTAVKLLNAEPYVSSTGDLLTRTVRRHFGSVAGRFMTVLLESLLGPQAAAAKAELFYLIRAHLNAGGGGGLRGFCEVLLAWVRSPVAEIYRGHVLLDAMLVVPETVPRLLRAVPRGHRSQVALDIARLCVEATPILTSATIDATLLGDFEESDAFAERFQAWLEDPENAENMRRISVATSIVQLEEGQPNARQKTRIYFAVEVATGAAQQRFMYWLDSGLVSFKLDRLPMGMYGGGGIGLTSLIRYGRWLQRQGDSTSFLLLRLTGAIAQRFVPGNVRLQYASLLDFVHASDNLAVVDRFFTIVSEMPVPNAPSMSTWYQPVLAWMYDSATPLEVRGALCLGMMRLVGGHTAADIELTPLIALLSEFSREDQLEIVQAAYRIRGSRFRFDGSRQLANDILMTIFWQRIVEALDADIDSDSFQLASVVVEAIGGEGVDQSVRTMVICDLILGLRSNHSSQEKVWHMLPVEDRLHAMVDFATQQRYRSAFSLASQISDGLVGLTIEELTALRETRPAEHVTLEAGDVESNFVGLERRLQGDRSMNLQEAVAILVAVRKDCEGPVRAGNQQFLTFSHQLDTVLAAAAAVPEGAAALQSSLSSEAAEDLPANLMEALGASSEWRRQQSSTSHDSVQSSSPVRPTVNRRNIVAAMNRVVASAPRGTSANRAVLTASARNLPFIY